MKEPARRVKTLIEPGVKALGYDLLGVEYQLRGRAALLRVYIDRDEGITVTDCERVSYQVGGVLDVENPISSAYDLEVSSPGLDRPLFEPEHYDQHHGQEAKVRLSQPIAGRRAFRGILGGCRDGKVLLHDGETEHALPFDAIGQARLVPKPVVPRKAARPRRSGQSARGSDRSDRSGRSAKAKAGAGAGDHPQPAGLRDSSEDDNTRSR